MSQTTIAELQAQYKEFNFEQLMGLDISTMSENQLRALRNELQDRRANPAARRSAVKKESKMTQAVNSKKLTDLNELLDLA